MTRALFIASVVVSSGLIAAVYLAGGYYAIGGILLMIGVGWILGLLRNWTWVSIPGLYALYGFAAAGFFLELSSSLSAGLAPMLLFSGGLFDLLAWDLSDFYFRLRLASPEDDIGGLERRHLLRLVGVCFGGLVLSLFASTVRVKYSFELSAVLILIGMWGIGRVISWMMQH